MGGTAGHGAPVTAQPKRSAPSLALEAAALAYARAHRALQRATPKPWIILTPEARARVEAKRLAMVRAEGALKVAARALGRGAPRD